MCYSYKASLKLCNTKTTNYIAKKYVASETETEIESEQQKKEAEQILTSVWFDQSLSEQTVSKRVDHSMKLDVGLAKQIV